MTFYIDALNKENRTKLEKYVKDNFNPREAICDNGGYYSSYTCGDINISHVHDYIEIRIGNNELFSIEYNKGHLFCSLYAKAKSYDTEKWEKKRNEEAAKIIENLK